MSENIQNEDTEAKERRIKERSEKLQKFTSSVAAAISAIALGATVTFTTGLFTEQKKTFSQSELSQMVTTIESDFEKQKVELNELQVKISAINENLNKITTLPDGNKWEVQSSKLEQEIAILNNRLSALEDALTLNPAKSLAIPILRKDLENTDKGIRAEITQTKAEIDRIYDQNKWFLGLMFTMALSVFGIAISSFFGKKSS